MTDSYLLLSWRDAIDVVVASILFWGLISWLRRTHALAAFVGLAILAAVYLGAGQLELRLTAWIFQGFAAVLLVLVVVVFQEDLRRLLEQIGAWGLRRRRPPPPSEGSDILVRTSAHLSQTRTGALVVLPGQEPLERHLDGGVFLGGKLSTPLLLSLFDPHSPGHDGAIIVVGEQVDRFAVHLPLSADHAQLADVGTRHAAALGLAERSDALSIVVSEERGTVSVARMGRLRRLGNPQELTPILREFRESLTDSPATRRSFRRFAGRQWRPLVFSVLLASALWLLLGPGAGVVRVARTAPVVVENLPEGYELESISPDRVTVTLSGPRRVLLFGAVEGVNVRIDAFLAKLGRRTFQIESSQVENPPGTDGEDIEPSSVRLSLKERGQPASRD